MAIFDSDSFASRIRLPVTHQMASNFIAQTEALAGGVFIARG